MCKNYNYCKHSKNYCKCESHSRKHKCRKQHKSTIYDVVLKNGRVISTTEDINGPVFDKVCNVGIIGDKICKVTRKDLIGKEEVDCCGLVVCAGFTDCHQHGVGVRSIQHRSARDGCTMTLDTELGTLNVDKHLEEYEDRGMLINFGSTSSNINSHSLIYSGMREEKVAIPFATQAYSTIGSPYATQVGNLDVWNVEPNPALVDIAGLFDAPLGQVVSRYPCFNVNAYLDAFLTYFNGDNDATAPAAVLTPDEEEQYFKVLEWGLQDRHVGIGIEQYNNYPFIKNWAELNANSDVTPVWQVGELTDFAKKHIDLSLKYNCTIFIHSSLNSNISNSNISTSRIWLDYLKTFPKPGPRFQFVHITSSSAGGQDSSFHNETIDLVTQAIDQGWTNITMEQYTYNLGSSGAAGFDLQVLLDSGITADEIIGSPVSVPEPDGETFVSLSLQAAADMLSDTIENVWLTWQLNGVGIVIPNQRQENVDYALESKYVTPASDGIINLSGGGNPRRVGNFARFLRRNVRERGKVSIPDAVRKLTSLTLKPLKGSDSRFDLMGEIKKGYYADITCWNPDTVKENATAETPDGKSTGIPFVLVNGKFVVKDEQVVEKVFPGQILGGGLKAPGRPRLCLKPFDQITCTAPGDDIFKNCYSSCSEPCQNNQSFNASNAQNQLDEETMHRIKHAFGGCC